MHKKALLVQSGQDPAAKNKHIKMHMEGETLPAVMETIYSREMHLSRDKGLSCLMVEELAIIIELILLVPCTSDHSQMF